MSQSEVFLGLLGEGGNSGTWSYNLVTRQLDADANTCQLMQCPNPPLRGLADLLACVLPADRVLLEQDLQAAIDSKGSFVRTFGLRGMAETGRLTVRARWLALPDAGALFGVVERCLLSTREAQQKEQRFEQLRNALIQSPVVLYEQDAQLRYEWVLAPRLGLSTDAITGGLASDFMEPESAAEIDRIKRDVMASGKSVRRRVHIRSKGGRGGDFDVYLSPRHGPDGKINGVISVAVDMVKPGVREQQLLTVFESAPVPISLSRLTDGVFLQVNTQFLELFGYCLDEVLGCSAIDLQLWHQAEDRDRMLAELHASGRVRNLVAGYRHQSGRTGRVQMSVELVEVEGERLLLAVLSDINALEQARLSLAQSEARYKLLSEASFEGVGLSKDGIVLDANEQIVRILGVAREGLIGKSVTHNMRPADVPKALQALRAGGDSHNEYEYLRPDGRKVILEVSSKDLAQGDTVLRISALRDVTERRQKELELQVLQIRFARMVDSNMVGVYVARPSGEILEANDYFLNLIGRSRVELDRGLLNWQELTPSHAMPASLAGRDDLLRTGVCRPYEKQYWRPGGATVDVLVALAHLPAVDYQILAIVVDISALKTAQTQLQNVNAQLLERTRAAERAEAAKTLFLSSVSHELRTPLHTMLGHLRLMRKRAQGEDLRQLTVVERSSSHLLRLIEDLLEYNHAKISPERLEPERVVLQGFLDSMQMIGNAAMAESDNQFVIQLGDDLPTTLVVDEGRLTQVLRILIDNARKYTRAGVVLFSLSLESDRRTADGSAHCGLRFSVEDNGRGIDAADVAHIFEPLNRGSLAPELHGKGHGLGLGLAIAAQWIERMGSTITVQTMRGVGSAFSFVLDLAVGFETVAPAQASLHSPHFSLQTPLLKLNMHALSANELNSLGELIHMGRLGRLRNWAHALEMRYPQQQEAAALVAELAANADLDALEALHLRWAALGQQEESNNRPRED